MFSNLLLLWSFCKRYFLRRAMSYAASSRLEAAER